MPDTALAAEDLMTLIHTALKGFVETEKHGFLSTARDPAEITELLGQAPGRFRVILNWTGEEPVGQRSSGIVKHTFTVVVSHNRGLSILKGENIFKDRAGDPPLMTLSGEVRDKLRGMRFPDRVTDQRLTYGGSQTVIVDSNNPITGMIDAFAQTWTITAALPAEVAS